MKVPELSHLQFLVLARLLTAEQSGAEIRADLKRFRVRQSGPAFYQMMARLEKAGLVDGWYTQEVIEGQIIKQRHYRVTAPGRRAWQECRSFYERTIDDVTEGLSHA